MNAAARGTWGSQLCSFLRSFLSVCMCMLYLQPCAGASAKSVLSQDCLMSRDKWCWDILGLCGL
eukprot:2148110-Prymnesium_polylepis.1